MEDVLSALQDAGVKADDAPLVVGGLVFVVLLVLALVVSKAMKKSGSSPDPDNPWIVSDKPQAPPPGVTPSNAPGMPAADDMLRAVMDSADMTPEHRKSVEKLRFMAEMGTSGHGGATFSSHHSNSLTFTTRDGAGPPQTVTLDTEVLDRARQMLKDGSTMEDICRTLAPPYAGWHKKEQEMFQRMMKSFLEGGFPKFGR